jgi:hypothetical protein
MVMKTKWSVSFKGSDLFVYPIKHSIDYEKILLNYPKIIQEVPLKIIASYLNVTVERLSRIRAKI